MPKLRRENITRPTLGRFVSSHFPRAQFYLSDCVFIDDLLDTGVMEGPERDGSLSSSFSGNLAVFLDNRKVTTQLAGCSVSGAWTSRGETALPGTQLKLLNFAALAQKIRGSRGTGPGDAQPWLCESAAAVSEPPHSVVALQAGTSLLTSLFSSPRQPVRGDNVSMAENSGQWAVDSA